MRDLILGFGVEFLLLDLLALLGVWLWGYFSGRKSRKRSLEKPQGNSIFEIRGDAYGVKKGTIVRMDCYQLALWLLQTSAWGRVAIAAKDFRVFLDGREQFPSPSAR